MRSKTGGPVFRRHNGKAPREFLSNGPFTLCALSRLRLLTSQDLHHVHASGPRGGNCSGNDG
jgi:hypothetical protein